MFYAHKSLLRIQTLERENLSHLRKAHEVIISIDSIAAATAVASVGTRVDLDAVKQK